MILLLSLLACTDRPSGTSGLPGHAVLHLDAAWDTRPWETSAGSAQQTLQATFTLPDADLDGTLYLEGAWWTVQATLNGTALPPATGGLVPLWIPLDGGLRAGQNTLQLTLAAPAPGTSTLETGGSLSSRDRSGAARAQLLRPPLLLLHPPGAHLSALALHAAADGRLGAQAEVEDAPPGATVRFQAVLDGAVLATLGEAPVEDGRAHLPPEADWPERRRWAAPDAEAPLFWLRAELRDAQGAVLDQQAERVGARAVTVADGRLQVDGTPWVLLGARVVHDPRTPFAAQLSALSGGHIGALEIHGEGLQTDWLDAADELGLPLVVVPRCIGRAGRGAGQPPADLVGLHRAQDGRLLRLLGHHPAAVLLATEGPVPGASLWSDRLLVGRLEDGARLPVAGDPTQGRVDLAAQFLQLSEAGAACHPGQTCGPTWITEITPWWKQQRSGLPPVPTLWQATAAAFSAVLAQGGPGGVVPTPDGPRDQDGWAEAWRGVAEQHGLRQPSGDGRGPATVQVRGAQPGALVWLEAPHLPPVVAVASPQGEATLSLYHQGAAEVRSAGRAVQAVQLRAGQWRRFAWEPAVTTVALEGGGG